MIDVTHRISGVARRVGTRTLAASEARVITVARSFPDIAQATDLDTLEYRKLSFVFGVESLPVTL